MIPRTTAEVSIAPEGRGYRTLSPGPGEPHLVRTELLAREPSLDDARTLVRFVHITDFQLADLASPGRLDFLQRFADRSEWADMLPAYRPQELLSLHAFEAMTRTVRQLAGIDFVLTTGDNTDTAALNELRAFLSIMDGGASVDPTFGVSDLRAIPSYTVSGQYWNPEPESRDDYKARHGFPDHPGVLKAAGEPIDTVGLGLKWLGCFGNHDCLAQGRATPTREFQSLVTGAHRPTTPPDPLPESVSMADYAADPVRLSAGAGLSIEARSDRRVVSKDEYISAHREAGHGFTDGVAYYCDDEFPGVRIIVLDTTNPAGGVTGSIGAVQRAWLIERLAEADDDGRVVVIASHHGLSMMDNDLGDQQRFLAADIERLMHRFDNVVLWLTGHIHKNLVIPRPGRSGGFWEVSTSAMAEWPTQARLVELLVRGENLVIRCTMVDHGAPVGPGAQLDLWDLASLHRELAANEPTRVGGPESAGTPLDRNVDLLVPISSALARRLR